jgi:hypothetical protein
MRVIVRVDDNYEPGDVAVDWREQNVHIVFLYHKLNSFCVDINELADLPNDSRIIHISEDIEGVPAHHDASTIVQSPSPSWGLSRTSQSIRPLDDEYSYRHTGTGITAYIMDSGLRPTHEDYASRFVTSPSATGVDDLDHGTNIASIVGGTTRGIAKGVTIVDARIANPGSGNASISNVVNVANWIIANNEGQATGTFCYQFTGDDSTLAPLEDALTAMHDAGVFIVAIAQNWGDDYAATGGGGVRYPFVNQNDVLVIGAIMADDTHIYNYGDRIDMYAPGHGVDTASATSDNAYLSGRNGTSYSAPHVAGIIALLLEQDPTLTFNEIRTLLINNASSGIVGLPSNSHDRIAYSLIELEAGQWIETTQFTGITQNQYQDDSVVPGEWYRYRVSGDGSDYTDWVQAQAPTAETGTGGSTVGVNVTTVQQGSKNASGGSVVSCDTTTVQAGSKQSTNAGTTTVDVTTVGAGDKQESTVGAGGSTTSVTVATVGAGNKTSTGASVTTTETSTLGQGLKGATGSNIVDTSVETVAAGSKATTSAGTTDIIITTVGTGTKQESTVGGGGSTVNVTAHTVGSGFKGGLGGDTTTVAIDLDGEGYKWVSGGVTTTVLVSTVGLGFNPETPISHRNITFELSEVDFKWVFGEVKQNTILSDVTLADDAIVVTSVYQTQLVFADAAVKMNVSEVSRKALPRYQGCPN